MWKAFLQQGEQVGTLKLLGPDGHPREVEYTAKESVLPARHVLVLRNSVSPGKTAQDKIPTIPSWLQDFALFLLNANGEIAAWYAGAERIFGYGSGQAVGQHLSMLYPADNISRRRLDEELRRSVVEGHSGNEGWCMRKDASRFWANVITMALKDENGNLQGFARVVRDFTGRHQLKPERGRMHPRNSRPQEELTQEEHTIVGVVSGEYDKIPEANDAFLEIVGYSREDLLTGRLRWPDLTPPEDFAADEYAHEEALRFGACTPFQKHLLRRDGTRALVQMATSVLKLSPFRWISFIREIIDDEPIERVSDKAPERKHHFEEIIGRSAALNRVLSQVELVAPTNATVLILGETGTGKELVARAVHRTSPRRDRPFITLNCAAIPTGLLESELFGYERGAFTGALSQKLGRFEMANTGTLFLDEVGDIPLSLQPKLLRALQEKSFERLGGTKTIPINVRLVAATNRNLTQMMGDKLFRSDLYYRLKVFPITTSPLRDHSEDIAVLAWHFTRKFALEMGKRIETISPKTMLALESWPWPGNVRELENFIERSVILSSGSALLAPLAELRTDAAEHSRTNSLENMEREHIIRVFREAGGVVTETAIQLGIPRTTLNALMHKLGISRKDL
jgi:formate hydrogenlyase transcriptional activator